MSKILYLDEARQHTLSAGPTHMIRLVPGRNVVEDADFEAVLGAGVDGNISRLEDMIDAGIVKVHNEAMNIAKLKSKEALELVSLETTEQSLLELHEQESSGKKRKAIISAIEKRIDELEDANDPNSSAKE